MHTTEPVVLAAGEVRLTLDRFALTSNNISYALSGDFLDYWGFFPAEAGWGRLPAMGYGIVSESANPDIAEGGRYFGFFPVGNEHIVQAQTSRGGFIDAGTHREKHAMAYRAFDKVPDTEGVPVMVTTLAVQLPVTPVGKPVTVAPVAVVVA